MAFPLEKAYSPVPECDDTRGLLSEDSCTQYNRRKRSHRGLSTITAGVLVLIICLLASFVGVWIGRRYPSDDGAIRHVSKFSPIMDDVDITFHTVRFNGTFTHENIYRQGPGPDVDAAWEALGVGFRSVIVPDSIAAKTGLTKDHVRIKSKYGGGYPVFVEGLHQLHCLNLLRKSLYYNYEYYHSRGDGAFSDPEEVQRWHITHCLDFLRQRLMCGMDIGVFGSVWVHGKLTERSIGLRPFVDFNTQHVCRDFDAIRNWAEKHQQPEETPHDFLELPQPGDGVRINNGPP